MASNEAKLYGIYRGRQFRKWTATHNFVDIVEAIVRDHGLSQVIRCRVVVSGADLVQIGNSTARAFKRRRYGDVEYCISTHSDTVEKAERLRELAQKLSLDLQVEVVPPSVWQAEFESEMLA